MISLRSLVDELLHVFLDNWRLVLSAIGSGVGIGWLADAINDGPLFTKWLWNHCWFDAICVQNTATQTLISIGLALLVSLVCAFALVSQVGKGKVVQLRPQALRPHKILIMWLSTGKECIAPASDGSIQVTWGTGGQQIGPFRLTDDADADAKATNTGWWNMWQHLRAVQPHASQLRRLHMLVSAGPKGSVQRHDDAAQVLKHYLRLDDKVIAPPTLINEHDIQSQIETVRQLIAQIKKTMPGISDDDIMVDCTGGLKLSSIAAACATLNNAIELQYVNTDPTDLSVKTYQLVYLAPQI